MLENKLVSGLDIDLSIYGLGIIKQPKIIQLTSLPFEDFISPFIMLDRLYDKIQEESDSYQEISKLYLFAEAEILSQKIIESEREQDRKARFFDPYIERKRYYGFIDKITSVLCLLYDCSESDLNIQQEDEGFLFYIKDKAIIDKDNFDVLLKVIYKMFDVDITSILSQEGDEWVEVTGSEREKKLIEKFKKKAEERKKRESLHLCDYINYVVLQNNIDYNSVLNWTYYQLIKFFQAKILIERQDFEKAIFSSMRSNLKADEITDWKKELKIKIDESIY